MFLRFFCSSSKLQYKSEKLIYSYCFVINIKLQYNIDICIDRNDLVAQIVVLK